MSGETIRSVVIYRPPHLPIQTFLDDFQILLNELSKSNCKILIVGDFNIHFDKQHDSNTTRFIDILNINSLTQHVKTATHAKGHIIDLVLTRDSEISFRNLTVIDDVISDHFPVFVDLNIIKPAPVTKTVTLRKQSDFNKDQFIKELDSTDFSSIGSLPDVNSKALAYYSSLYCAYDKVLPERTKTFILRPNTEWFNDEVLQAKRDRNKAEKVWRKSNLHVHKDIYREQKLNFQALVKSAKKSYYTNKIDASSNKAKELFRVSNALLSHNYGQSILPDCESSSELANTFSDYFTYKIQAIRDNLQPSQHGSTPFSFWFIVTSCQLNHLP
ncbi:hypothetical protein SNE40_000461 [Patella caerulea]|uniref:Endonuclease/exonuclease/phosphatase domain-containing protein n=1 Tax=Patella caerulea TaxID=87958 RepID=A0AAN8KEQ0_PATCE